MSLTTVNSDCGGAPRRESAACTTRLCGRTFAAASAASGSASTSNPVQIDLQEDGDAPIGSFVAHSSDVKFEITLARCGDLLEVSRAKLDQVPARQLLPAGENDSVKLMSEELMRGGQRRVYLRAVEKVRDLL